METESNKDHKKRFTSDKCETIKESVMEDKNTNHAHGDKCDNHRECRECSEEGRSNKGNGVMGSIDEENGVENGINNNDQQNKNFGNQDIIDDCKVDSNVQGNNHKVTDDVSQLENGAAEHLEESNFTCEITDVMKKLLELDNKLIKSKNKVVHLPARPNVVTILESYVREYAINQICGPPEKSRRKYKRQQKYQNGHLDTDQLNRSVNICKEVADGVRIYFDYTLNGLLLYNEEREQYEQSCHMTVAKEPDSKLNITSLKKKEANKIFLPPGCSLRYKQSTCTENVVKFDGRMGTPNVKVDSTGEYVIKSEGKVCTLANTSTGGNSEETENPNIMGTCNPNKEPCIPSVSSKEEALSAFRDNLSSIASVSSKHLSQSVKSNVPSAEGMSPRDYHTSLKYLLPHLFDWQLVPESLYTEKPIMPSLVYGAVHLARLLVILPSLLLKTKIPAKKHKIVLRHLQMILRYLEQNNDWFAENVYQDNCLQLKQNG